MPAWEPDREGVQGQSAAVPPPPVLVAKPATPVRDEAKPPAVKSRSTRREAQELIDASARESVEARLTLMRNARDEATRLRAAEGLSAAAGLLAPQVSVVHHVVSDMREAFDDLSRMLGDGSSGVLDVESSEVDG